MVRRFNATSIVRSCAEVVFVSFSGLLHFHRGGKNIQVVTIAVVKHGVGDVVSWGGGGGAMTGVRGWFRGVGKLSGHASAEYGGGALDIATDMSFKPVAVLKALGHLISDNGSIAADFEAAKDAAWLSFFRFYGPGLDGLPLHRKQSLLDSFCLSHFRFRWSRWPFSKYYAKQLDSFQSNVLTQILGLVPRHAESGDDFFRRQRCLAGRILDHIGRWSVRWAKDVTAWHSHCLRAYL